MKESSEFNKEMNKCNNYDKYVGMDVHKNSISVAVAAAGRISTARSTTGLKPFVA